ncbi:hypothetical protein Aperf_G00000067841 [Anoplocephala perfoliata]
MTTGCTTYAELVARHLEGFLAASEGLPLAEALVRRLACITTWSDAGSTISIPSAGKFVLAPGALLKRLRTQHPNLAENYLWLRIFKAGDKPLGLSILGRYTDTPPFTLLFCLLGDLSNEYYYRLWRYAGARYAIQSLEAAYFQNENPSLRRSPLRLTIEQFAVGMVGEIGYKE